MSKETAKEINKKKLEIICLKPFFLSEKKKK